MTKLEPKQILICFIYNSVCVFLLLALNYYLSQRNGYHLNMIMLWIIAEAAALIVAIVYELKRRKK